MTVTWPRRAASSGYGALQFCGLHRQNHIAIQRIIARGMMAVVKGTWHGLMEAHRTFRRLKAYRQLPLLRAALQRIADRRRAAKTNALPLAA